MSQHNPWAGLGLLVVLAGLPACATARPGVATAAVGPGPSQHEPSIADFAEGDREAVAAMLRDVATRFRSPYAVLPGARAVTLLLTCRVESVRPGNSGRAGVVGVKCLSGGPQLDLVIGESADFHHQPGWVQEEFGVSTETVAVGEVRTCVVYGSGFGGRLWKRFLVFAGPVHGPRGG